MRIQKEQQTMIAKRTAVMALKQAELRFSISTLLAKRRNIEIY
jgi:hypothetical protein